MDVVKNLYSIIKGDTSSNPEVLAYPFWKSASFEIPGTNNHGMSFEKLEAEAELATNINDTKFLFSWVAFYTTLVVDHQQFCARGTVSNDEAVGIALGSKH